MITNRRLPETRSRVDRFYDMIPAGHPLADYTVVIRVGKPHRKDYSEELYLVQEAPGPIAGAYCFLFLKDRDDEPEVYEVVYARRRGGWCTCKGFRCQNVCKHYDVVCDAVNHGLPEPGDYADVKTEYTREG